MTVDKKKGSDDINFKLLSVAALINKLKDGISIEDLYLDAERKFDILTDLINGAYTNNTSNGMIGYTIDELKKYSYIVLNRLVSESNSDPYQTLCVHQSATIREIKRRRNKLLHIFHPDMSQADLSNGTRTRKITEAYEKIVSDQNKGINGSSNSKIPFPPSYPFRKKYYENRLTLIFIFVVLLLFILGLMKKTNFF